MAVIFLHPQTPRNNMKKFMDLDFIKTSICACAAAAMLIFCATATFGQESTADIDTKKPESASTEKADKAKNDESLQSKFGEPENAVAKYKPIVEGSRVTKHAKPLTENVDTVVPEPGKQTTGDSDWHIAFAPYLYLSGLEGN